MEFEAGSFRDRTSRVFYSGGEVFRAVSESALAEWRAVKETAFFRRLSAENKIVRTQEVSTVGAPAGSWAGVLRHERVPFVSYPYEWSFGMLQDAALLQLELLEAALAESVTLKDATPYNVQWLGTAPVFIDVPSFRRWRAGEPWLGYRQFCELYLYPLMLEAYKGVPFQAWLRGRIDGIPPREARSLFSIRDLFRPGVFSHVLLHARSEARYDHATSANVRHEFAAAGFGKELILANVRGLARLVRGLRPRAASSAWAGYADANSYDAADREVKEQFVAVAAATRSWDLVWDLGANTGTYSRIVARQARLVVALDADRVAVEQLYRETRRAGPDNLLPLVCQLADPSPGQGWRGSERKDLPGRGRPDLALCLALIHHLVIGANLGLRDVLDWLAGLAGHVVLEFVTRADPMVERLLRHRDEDYADYDLAPFEAALHERFEVLRHVPLPSGRRILYFARSRHAG